MSFGAISSSSDDAIDRARDEFRAEWGSDRRPSIESYLDRTPETARDELLDRLLALEFGLRQSAGECPSLEEYLERFPGEAERVRNVHREVTSAGEPTVPPSTRDPTPGTRAIVVVAEAHLESIAAVWSDQPRSRQLPSLFECFVILRYVRARSWSDQARRMMRSAARYYLLRFGALLTLVALLAGVAWYQGERSASLALFNQAQKADFGDLPSLFPQIQRRRAWLRASLERIEARPFDAGARARHVAGILLFLDQPTPDRLAFLHDRLFSADPEEMVAILKALAAHPNQAGSKSLMARMEDEQVEQASRLRAACGLMAVAPAGKDWKSFTPVLVRALLAEDQRSLSRWLQFLEPAGPDLVTDLELACLNHDLDAPSRIMAAEALAGLLARKNDAAGMARSAVRVAPDASRVLVRRLSRMDGLNPVLDLLTSIVEGSPDALTPGRDDEGDALHRANAAWALLVLDRPAPIWALLRHRPDPTLRSELIRRLGEPPVSHKLLLDRFREPGRVTSQKQAILLALAESNLDILSAHDRGEYLALAERLYREAAAPGLHSAAGLLLRRLGHPPDLGSSTGVPPGPEGTGWYLGPNGQTFARLPAPLRILMGSSSSDEGREGGRLIGERRHFRQIDRRLAVSTTEVTRAQFEAFHPSPPTQTEHVADEIDSPATRVTWYDAARYCNWLSDQAKIPQDQWCYPEPIGPGMTLTASAVDKTGYRLPTEAEWEALCRSGTMTVRPFGRSADLLPRYAWVGINAQEHPHPVGRLLPNEFGLFDVLGNVWEWCHDGPLQPDREDFPIYPQGTHMRPAFDPIREAVIVDSSYRMLRGGAFDGTSSMARSARRYDRTVITASPNVGFRVVRTLPPRRGLVD